MFSCLYLSILKQNQLLILNCAEKYNISYLAFGIISKKFYFSHFALFNSKSIKFYFLYKFNCNHLYRMFCTQPNSDLSSPIQYNSLSLPSCIHNLWQQDQWFCLKLKTHNCCYQSDLKSINYLPLSLRYVHFAVSINLGGFGVVEVLFSSATCLSKSSKSGLSEEDSTE